jgi:small subunit ribosomal protein S21
MSRIDVRPGQDIASALRAFKKRCAKDGILKDFKRAQRFEKPSDRKRKDARESAKRCRMVQRLLDKY